MFCFTLTYFIRYVIFTYKYVENFACVLLDTTKATIILQLQCKLRNTIMKYKGDKKHVIMVQSKCVNVITVEALFKHYKVIRHIRTHEYTFSANSTFSHTLCWSLWHFKHLVCPFYIINTLTLFSHSQLDMIYQPNRNFYIQAV